MGDYVPVFDDGDDLTMTAGAAITGGQLVYVSGSKAVTPTAAATAAWLGVALFDAASGAPVTVTSAGVQELTAAATIAPGDVLMAAAGGQVTPFTGTTYSQVVGIALTGGAANAKVRVRLVR